MPNFSAYKEYLQIAELTASSKIFQNSAIDLDREAIASAVTTLSFSTFLCLKPH